MAARYNTGFAVRLFRSNALGGFAKPGNAIFDPNPPYEACGSGFSQEDSIERYNVYLVLKDWGGTDKELVALSFERSQNGTPNRRYT